MNFRVYGKGFRLYGYLPAIIKVNIKLIYKTYLRFKKEKRPQSIHKYITFVSKHNLKRKI